MSLNLHAAVRAPIQAVNADTPSWWYVNKGPQPSLSGPGSVASYETAIPVQCQIQPPSGRDLKFIDYLQLQGIIRTVFMFFNPGGLNRVNQTGNDLLLFPQWTGAPNDAWKVYQIPEYWGVGSGGWSKVFAVLQTDRLYSALDDAGLLILDDNGRIVRSK